MGLRLLGQCAAIAGIVALAGCSQTREFPECGSPHTLGLLGDLVDTKIADISDSIIIVNDRQTVAARLEHISTEERNLTLAICDNSDLALRNNFSKRMGEKPEACRKRIDSLFDTMSQNVVAQTSTDFPTIAPEFRNDVDGFIAAQAKEREAALAQQSPYTFADIVETERNGMTRMVACTANIDFDLGEIGKKQLPVTYTVHDTGNNVFNLTVKGLQDYEVVLPPDPSAESSSEAAAADTASSSAPAN